MLWPMYHGHAQVILIVGDAVRRQGFSNEAATSLFCKANENSGQTRKNIGVFCLVFLFVYNIYLHV